MNSVICNSHTLAKVMVSFPEQNKKEWIWDVCWYNTCMRYDRKLLDTKKELIYCRNIIFRSFLNFLRTFLIVMLSNSSLGKALEFSIVREVMKILLVTIDFQDFLLILMKSFLTSYTKISCFNKSSEILSTNFWHSNVVFSLYSMQTFLWRARK